MQKKSIETKLFVWVLGFCLIISIGSASLIIHYEKKIRIKNTKESLRLVASRYRNWLDETLQKKQAIGKAGNRIVLQALLEPWKTDKHIHIQKDKDGAYRQTDNFSGAFLSRNSNLTNEQNKNFQITEALWKIIGPLITTDFFNFYFISNKNFIRIYPKDWAMEIEADHDFNHDLFYAIATPQNNPLKKPKWTEVYYDSIWKKWMISLIIPLYDGHRFLGITGSDFILDDIFNDIQKMATIEGWCKGFLFDGKGNLIVHADYQNEILKKQQSMNTQLTFKDLKNKGLADLIKASLSKNYKYGRPISFMDKNELSYAVVEPVGILGWNLSIYTSHSTTEEGLFFLQIGIFAASICLAVLLAFFLKYGFNKIILTRLNKLGEGVSAISAGNHDFELKVMDNDEIGTLEKGFIDMEKSVKDKITELIQKNEELQQFAYVASHDLQEPLRMVSSYVQLLSRRYKGKLDEDADDFIAFAVDGANRMHILINDLLTYSRVGTKGNPFKHVNLNDVMQNAIKNLETSINENEAQINHDTLPEVVADEIQIGQLFQNLLGNAIKFRQENRSPVIRIKAKEKDKFWLFSVEDNGIGMKPEFATRIFIIFQRLHNRSEYPGTGIGLAICKKIVERHGGRIWVESEPGSGTTFYFEIPKMEVEQ